MSDLQDVKGLVFDIQHYSIHDGPGIRTTVFLNGCPLRCLWCQNPESQVMKPQLSYLTDKCIGCGACVSNCPKSAITLSGNKVKSDRSLCDACGGCIEICPVSARSIIGKELTAGEVFKEVASDDIFYKESNGGVTLSGGEVFNQPLFASSLLKLCKNAGIHTTIETCGYSNWEVMKQVLAYVDLVYYDFKHLDSSEHKKCTGVSNELILENAGKIHHELHLPMAARIPIIPGYNDSADNIRSTARFIAEELDKSIKVHLLPYHRLGEGKRKNLEIEGHNFSAALPDNGHMAELQSIVDSFGLTAVIGG